MNQRKSMFLSFLTLVGLVFVAATQSAAGSRLDEQPPLPSGNWTFSAGPYSGVGHETFPVDVYSVLTDADKGMTVMSVALNNRSGKDITVVKLHWTLTDRDKGNVLFEGHTSRINAAVGAGKQHILRQPVVSFARIVKSLMRRSALSGNYRLEITACEVVYADESSWTMKEESKLKFR